MEVTSGWLATLAALAAPAAAALAYAGRSGSKPHAVAAPPVAVGPTPRLGVMRPLRWYDIAAGLALALLPFAQFYGYLHFRTSGAFFAPLAVAMTMIMFVAIAAPRAINVEPLDLREWSLWFGVIGIGLAAALLLPPVGTILVLRGALIDIGAYSLSTVLIRIAHRRKMLHHPS